MCVRVCVLCVSLCVCVCIGKVPSADGVNQVIHHVGDARLLHPPSFCCAALRMDQTSAKHGNRMRVANGRGASPA